MVVVFKFPHLVASCSFKPKDDNLDLDLTISNTYAPSRFITRNGAPGKLRFYCTESKFGSSQIRSKAFN